MKMRLKNLRLKRVSLVNDPANEEALVVLFKSNDKPAQEAPVTKDDDVAMAAQRKRESEDADDEAKGMTSCKGCKSKMSKGAKFCPSCGDKVAMKGVGMELDKITDPDVRKQVEKLVSDLADAQAKLAAAPVEKKQTKEEDVLKDLSPAARALVEKAQATAAESAVKVAALSEALEKSADETIEKAFIEEVSRDYPNISGDPKVLGPILKRVSQGKTTKEDLAALQTVLKGASAAAKPIFRVVGGNERGGKGTAFEELDAKVKEFITKAGDKKPSYVDALDAVAKENPGLYTRYREEASTHTVAANGEEE